MSEELCPSCQKPVWAVRHGSFSVSVTCECGYDGPLYPVAKTPDPRIAVAENLAKALLIARPYIANVVESGESTNTVLDLETLDTALAEWHSTLNS